MYDPLVMAFIEKDYEYILEALQPLFLKNLQSVPPVTSGRLPPAIPNLMSQNYC